MDRQLRAITDGLAALPARVPVETTGRSINQVHVDIANATRMIDAVRGVAFGPDQYEDAQARLDHLDRMVADLGARVDGVRAQRDVVHQITRAYGEAQQAFDPTRLVDDIRGAAAARPNLADLPNVRDHLDALTQWMSDAVMRVRSDEVGPEDMTALGRVRGQLGRAAALVNRAFYSATLHHDPDAAEQHYGAALQALNRVDLSHLPDVPGARPKQREDESGYDTRSALIAAALRDNDFIPDLIIGLPTGGAHAANRIAGALAAMTDRMPEVSYLRPRAVKADSQSIMAGVEDPTRLRDPILAALREQAQRVARGGRLNMLIVDDGAESSGTMALAREVMERHAGALADHVEIRTAALNADETQLDDELVHRTGRRANPFDFMAASRLEAAGPRRAMNDFLYSEFPTGRPLRERPTDEAVVVRHDGPHRRAPIERLMRAQE